MSEAEIMEQVFSIWDRYWVLAQWWTSVSFALVMVSFFAANKLRLNLLVIIIALYAGYTFWVCMLLFYNLDVAYALGSDLVALEAAGKLESAGAKALLSNVYLNYGMWASKIIFPSTFLACTGYLFYAYFQNRHREDT